MSSGDYLAGVAYFLATLGPVVAAATIAIRRRYAYLTGLPRALALVTVATGGLVFAVVAPAALGILTRGTPIAASLALLAGACLMRPAPREQRPIEDPAPPASQPLSVVVAILAVGGVAIYELARLRVQIDQPITNIDMLAFHLPGVARFIQTGTLWHVSQFLAGFATGQYPNNGDFIILSTVLPWHDFAFSRLPGVLFFALTGVAVYALAVELRASRAAAATFAAVALIVPAFSSPALEGSIDSVTVSLFAVGVMFLLRHLRSDRLGELALAGLAIGISLGTKWFGLTDAIVLVAVWMAARLIARTPRARIARDAALAVAMMSLGGGIWLVRNLVESHNPLYPKAISIFGVQLFAGSHNDVIDRYGYTILEYLSKPSILRMYIYPGFKIEMGITGAVLLAGVVVAAACAIARARQPQADRVRAASVIALALAVIVFCAVYAVTPGSAYGPKGLPVEGFVNIRWLAPATAVAAAVCAWAASATGRRGIALEIAGLLAVADGIKLGPHIGAGALIEAGLIIFAGVILWRFLARSPPTRRHAGPAAIVAGALVAVIALSVAGRVDERSFDRAFYSPYDPVLQWLGGHARSGERIGFTGGVGTDELGDIMPAFGPRLGNSVTYVGDTVRQSVEVPSHLNSFKAELKAGHYDLLVIQLQYAGSTEQWARDLGYRLLDRSSALAVYEPPPRS